MLFAGWEPFLQPLFDHKLLRQRWRRIADKGAKNPFIAAVAEELPMRLAPVRRDFELTLDLFPPSPAIGAALAASSKIKTLRTLSAEDAEDFEALPLEKNSLDLIISCLSLQYANDLPGMLAQLRRALKPGGLLLGCLVGGDTLKELREVFAQVEMEIWGGVTPRIHPSIDIRQMGALLQRAKFSEVITDLEKYKLHYNGIPALLQDLRSWSPGNLLFERSRKFLRRNILTKLNRFSQERPLRREKVTISFELIWFSGWVK